MSFDRPSLAVIVDRVRADIEASLPETTARVPYSIEEALAIAVAGAAHQLHGHVAFLARQILPTTATGRWLLDHAAMRGIYPTSAVRATGTVLATGVDTSTIPAGTEWQRADSVLYRSTAEATISGGEASISVEAVEPGAAGNAPEATRVSLLSPVAGVDADAFVEAPGLDSGADEESPEALRLRVIADWQKPPRAGGAGDYERWALEVSGVTRAWEYPAALGPGTVVVLFARDNDLSPIPSESEVAEVQAYIDTVKPLTAEVVVSAPVEIPIDIEVHVTPYTDAVVAAVTAELTELFADRSAPGGRISLTHLGEAVSRAAGEKDHEIVAPAAAIEIPTDSLATIGTLTISELV